MSQQYIAVDLGYGDVKVAFLKGSKIETFKFPSAVVRARETHVNYGEDVTFNYNGKKYIVGEEAVQQALETRDFNFLVDFGALLIYVAIKKAGLDTNLPISIASGLSIIDWNEREILGNAIKNIVVNSEAIKIAGDIILYAQGQGIYKDIGLKENYVAIVDIGYNTLDYLVFKDGKPSKLESDATLNGIHNITERIRAILTKRLPKMKISEQFAKECFLNGGYDFAGERYSMESEIAIEKEEYSKEIVSILKTNYSNSYNFCKIVVFSGGGAYHLDPSALPTNAVWSAKPFEFSNVRGYLKMLREG